MLKNDSRTLHLVSAKEYLKFISEARSPVFHLFNISYFVESIFYILPYQASYCWL